MMLQGLCCFSGDYEGQPRILLACAVCLYFNPCALLHASSLVAINLTTAHFALLTDAVVSLQQYACRLGVG